ncbi:MAG TPA: hypothetical protein VFR81_14475 [Longimicrobium sp.]|nr:hypothetical protein [Longimicrobium sp.]
MWEGFVDFTGKLAASTRDAGIAPDELHRMPIAEYVDYVRQWDSEQSLA